ncbi:MAG: DUF2299 family protein [Candidatus Hodarchaeota archaeon]
MSTNKDLAAQIKQKITTWLTEENLFEKSIPPQQGLQYGFLFRFPPKAPAIYSIAVQQNILDSVIVARGVQVSPEHQNIIKNWQPKIRNAFLADFLINLHSHPIEFQIMYQNENLQGFKVVKRLFMESLTKNQFWKSVVSLQNASQSAILLIQKSTDTFAMRPHMPSGTRNLKRPEDSTGMFG